MSLTVGVDIGGTKVLGGVVDPEGRIVAQTRRDTPADDVDQTLRMIVEVVNELSEGRDVEAVGIGAAGWIDETRSTVLFAPNLAWRHEPLRDHLTARIDLPIVVENDANAAAWAEFQFGAARDATASMVMLTVGTGIGSGMVMNGEVVRGAHGMAAELGHVIATPGGLACGCGRQGCLEQYASGNALVRFVQAVAKEDAVRAARVLALADGIAGDITGPMVTEAAQQGDELCRAAFVEVGTWLGHGLADLVQILDPEVLIIGGGVIEAGDLLMGPTREAFADTLAQRSRLPMAEVRAALLGNTAGFVGAADLARRR